MTYSCLQTSCNISDYINQNIKYIDIKFDINYFDYTVSRNAEIVNTLINFFFFCVQTLPTSIKTTFKVNLDCEILDLLYYAKITILRDQIEFRGELVENGIYTPLHNLPLSLFPTNTPFLKALQKLH